MSDTLQTIRRSTHRFFSGTLLSRMTGMLRDMSMAYAFGTDPAIASFMVAFRFAHLLRRLFGEGALQSVFIPEFESLRQQNKTRAFSFFRDLSVSLTFFLIAIIGCGGAILSTIYFFADLHAETKEMIRLALLMMPSLLFICLFGLNSSLLQCEKKYFIPSAAPAVFNAVWIGVVLILSQIPPKQAMPWLALGVVVASFFQWLLTYPPSWRGVKKMLPPFSFSSIFSSDLRALLKPLSLGILGVSASQINNALDSLFALFAEPMGPAFLWYAIRIQQLPLALFGIAIAGAILPPLSRSLKANKPEEYRHFLHDALVRTWTFMLPLTGALFLFGEQSVNLLFGRGDFGPESVANTTYCLWAYGLGLLPSALILVLAPASYAQKNYLYPTLASFSGMFFNVCLNSLFIGFFHWGAVSVAIATSISAWINLFLIGWLLNKTGKAIFPISLWKRTVDGTLCSSVACMGIFLFFYYIKFPKFDLIFMSETSFIGQFLFLGFQTLVFGIFYLFGYFLISLPKSVNNFFEKST